MGTHPESNAHEGNGFAYLSESQQDVVVEIDLESPRITRRLPTGSGPDGVGYSRVLVAAARD